MSFDRDTWATPQYIFDWLNNIYNFNVDLCASAENYKYMNYFSKDFNALDRSWLSRDNARTVGFCNPPYSDISPWIDKAISEAENGFTTVMLIETPNGQKHYKQLFEKATSITFITGRLAFYNPHLKKHVSGNTRGSCVVEFSKKYNDLPIQIDHVDRELIKEVYNKSYDDGSCAW